MSVETQSPACTVRLNFQHHDRVDDVDEPFRRDLSASELVGKTLWLANDETARIERLMTGDWIHFSGHRSIPVAEFFDLPAGANSEIDIEGLAAADGYLWAVGSHSLTRKKPKRHENDAHEALARLTEVKQGPNRYFLGRVPLVDADASGLPELRRTSVDVSGNQLRMAGCLKSKNGRNHLIKSLEQDEQLAPFLTIPSKENGLDIEGIAARGERVFLGLRGPVLRGWAIVLEVHVKETKSGRLKLRKFDGGLRHRKHLLDLDGLGIRDLAADGDDLLILGGPTMDLDGPIDVYRWPQVLSGSEQPDVVTHDKLEHILSVPFGEGVDHPEGLTVVRRQGMGPMLLIVCDNPAPSRLHEDEAAIDADLFAMPFRRSQ